MKSCKSTHLKSLGNKGILLISPGFSAQDATLRCICEALLRKMEAKWSGIWPRDTREIPSSESNAMVTLRLLLTLKSYVTTLVILLWRSPLWHRAEAFPVFPHILISSNLSWHVQCATFFFPKKKFMCMSLAVTMYSQESGTSNTFSCQNLVEAGRDVKSQILCCTETFCTVRTMGPEWDGSSHRAIHSIVGKSLAPVASAAGGRQNVEDRRWQE